MPLGYLISVEEKWREDMAKSMKEDFDNDQMFAELFDLRKGSVEPLEAVDCGRGYVFLLGYLLEDDTLDAVLIGEDLAVTYDDGTTITSNCAATVTQIAKKIKIVDHAKLESLAESYHEQVPRIEETTPVQKGGFFARLFGKNTEAILEPVANANKIDPSLLSLFDQIKKFYSDAAKDNKAVFFMVSL